MWRGATDFASGVERWQFAFDDPALPVVTTITDPLDNVSTTTWASDRTSVHRKPRVTEIDGDCPQCGVGPNSQLAYGDAANPYRVTQETDGRGHVTKFEYDGNGQTTRRIEAFGTALERETTWTYEPGFPAFVATMTEPSTSGFPNSKITTFAYDASGDRTSQTIDGFEDGLAFNLITDFTYNAGGRVTTTDPPGYGIDDQTTFAYDATRGNGHLILASRTDPLIGATTFAYDAFNRRTGVTDPNGVVTETQYDALDRVRFVTQLGATMAGDLVTEYRYNVFGDLSQTILPEGNVIEYGYDAAGRLTTISRGPTDTDLRERTVFTLDGFRQPGQGRAGAVRHRRRHLDQRRPRRTSIYTTRCFVDQIVRAPGTPEESITENLYDCDGNLERVWDANHSSVVDPPSQLYAYDALDRLVSITQPWAGAGGGDAVTAYGYDVQDHLTMVTDAEANVTTYVYSDRDLMTEQTSPASGTTSYAYNEHGELVQEVDQRGVTVDRTVDELDRVTFADYPDATLDTTYVYDDLAVSFSKGRLTAIERDGASVDYTYDRFGRVTGDGALTFSYDQNGNPTTLGYPGGVSATYTYDFSDRPATLSVSDGVNPAQSVVASASYLPSGPLAGLTLGNGLTETRDFDGRYFPASIDLSGGLGRTWLYTTDKVGNITQIQESVGCPLNLAVDGQTVSSPQVFEACEEVSSQNTTLQAPAGSRLPDRAAGRPGGRVQRRGRGGRSRCRSTRGSTR